VVDAEHVGTAPFVLANTGSCYDRIVGALKRWHEDRGAENPELMAMVEARALIALVVDQLSQEDIARDIGEPPRHVAQYVADLRAVFPALAGCKRLPATGTAPQLDRRWTSRRRQKAPAGGAWSDADEALQRPCG
jgi:hypothetical protein